MALSKTKLMDLMVEERQIGLTLEKATSARATAKQLAEQNYLAALTAADDTYVTATQAATSRLHEIHAQLQQDGGWERKTGATNDAR